MAAVVIPILTTVVPMVLPLIVKLVDKIFGTKTGPAKLDAATQISNIILQELQKLAGGANSGIGMPSVPELQSLIQGIVDQLNKQGVLNGTATVIDAPVIPAAVSSNPAILAGVQQVFAGMMTILQTAAPGAVK